MFCILYIYIYIYKTNHIKILTTKIQRMRGSMGMEPLTFAILAGGFNQSTKQSVCYADTSNLALSCTNFAWRLVDWAYLRAQISRPTHIPMKILRCTKSNIGKQILR
jgi:hypothetical protein